MVTSPLRGRVVLAPRLNGDFVRFFSGGVCAKPLHLTADRKLDRVGSASGLRNVPVPGNTWPIVSPRDVLIVDRAVRLAQVSRVAARPVVANVVNLKSFRSVARGKEIGSAVRIPSAQAGNWATNLPVSVFVPRRVPLPALRALDHVAPKVRSRAVFHRNAAAKRAKFFPSGKHRPVPLAKSIDTVPQVGAFRTNARPPLGVFERGQRDATTLLAIMSVAESLPGRRVSA